MPDQMSEFIIQRRRWLNGSFFAAVYAMTHWMRFLRANHGILRKILFCIEFLYMLFNMVFSWFNLACFFLTFYFLGETISQKELDPFNGAGVFIFYALLGVYAVLLMCSVIASMGNRPQGSKWMYTFAFVFFAVIMLYTTFAAIFLTVKGIDLAVASIPSNTTVSGSSTDVLFGNDNFRSIIAALCGTVGLYLVASILFFDPWHMITSFVQYILIAPSFINVLNVYAFCNTHDVSWGTKGDNVVSTDLGVASMKKGEKEAVDVPVPSDQKDINQAYEEDLQSLSTPPPKEVASVDSRTAQEDYYKRFRTNVVLAWLICNGALIAAITSTQFASLLSPSSNAKGASQVQVDNFFVSNKFFSFVLYSVAGLAAFKFIGCFIYIVLAIFGRGR